MRSASLSVIGIGLPRAAEEAGDLRRVLDQVPGLVGHLHLHQHVAGEELALGVDLLVAACAPRRPPRSAPGLPRSARAMPFCCGLLLDRLRDLLLEARVDVDRHTSASAMVSASEPEHQCARHAPGSDRRRGRTSPRAIDITNTMAVVTSVSLRVGQVTLRSSWRTCADELAERGCVLVVVCLAAVSDCVQPSVAAAPFPRRCDQLAGVEGLEPPTPGFGDRCSTN